MRDFDDALADHIVGLRHNTRKRAIASFIAGANAVSLLMRNQLYDIDHLKPEDVKWTRQSRRNAETAKPQQIQHKSRQPYFIMGRNATV